MSRLFSKLIADVVERVSLVPGTGTQVYAEDRIAQMLQDKFDAVFSELWWPDYTRWFTRTIDGSTGLATLDLRSEGTTLPSSDGDGIATFLDVRAVYISTRDDALPHTPRGINPNRLTGTVARYIEGIQDSKLIKFWPITATSTVNIHARSHPGTFNNASVVYMDRMLLVAGATWDYLEDDATAPGAAEKFQVAFESRLQQLKELSAQHPIEFMAERNTVPDQWFEG